jgi:hypothetical protein
MFKQIQQFLSNAGLLSLPRPIDTALWQATLDQYSFLSTLPVSEQQQLRQLASEFLGDKEFAGANGLLVTDAIAVSIAAQACLPVLHLSLDYYADFKGIVIHPGAMLARREAVDAAGVHHRYSQALSGEAMQGGPITLSWQDAAPSSEQTAHGSNVVIHEFVHKIDMSDGSANGCPPLATRAAYTEWHQLMQAAYERFRAQLAMSQRFGQPTPWLDAYGATSPAEFFAVTSEAYFVNRQQFTAEFADLTLLFDAFYKPVKAQVLAS